jgi:hypothetical protein
MPVIPALGRLRQEDCEFKTCLGQTESSKKRRKRKVSNTSHE